MQEPKFQSKHFLFLHGIVGLFMPTQAIKHIHRQRGSLIRVNICVSLMASLTVCTWLCVA